MGTPKGNQTGTVRSPTYIISIPIYTAAADTRVYI